MSDYRDFQNYKMSSLEFTHNKGEEPFEVVEEEVQDLLWKWEIERKTVRLYFTQEQKDWLRKAISIFQAHELQPNNGVSHKDRIFTEAMVRYMMESFKENEERGGED